MLSRVAELAGRQITGQLAQTGRVEVVDLETVASSSRRSSDSSSRLDDARAAGAGRMVNSTMFRRGDSIVIHSHVVNTTDGRVVGEIEPVVGSSQNLMAALYQLRERVGGAVAALADTLYRPWSEAHSRTPTFAAFQEFIQGLDAMVHGTDGAVEHLTRAARLDTTFIEAKIWLIRQSNSNPADFAFTDSIQQSALAQRGQLSPFDAASLDRVVAFRARAWEQVYRASQRLMEIAPNTQDAQHYLAEAALYTRRYDEALRLLHRLHSSNGWMNGVAEQWLQWDMAIHHVLGDDAAALEHWRGLRALKPAVYRVCRLGVARYAAMGDEAHVDSLVAECSRMPGAPAVTPRRAYVDAIAQYLAAGHNAAARRAAEQIVPELTQRAETDQRAGVDLGIVYCMLGDWRRAYATLRSTRDSASGVISIPLAIAAAHVGDTAMVKAALRSLDEDAMRFRTPGLIAQSRAMIVLASGDRATAIGLMREALSRGKIDFWAWPETWEFSSLRGDKRFDALIGPVK